MIRTYTIRNQRSADQLKVGVALSIKVIYFLMTTRFTGYITARACVTI